MINILHCKHHTQKKTLFRISKTMQQDAKLRHVIKNPACQYKSLCAVNVVCRHLLSRPSGGKQTQQRQLLPLPDTQAHDGSNDREKVNTASVIERRVKKLSQYLLFF